MEKDKLESIVKFLEWRRARLWRTIERLDSKDPWLAEKAESDVDEDLKSLESAFHQAHGFLFRHRVFLVLFLAAAEFILVPGAWAGEGGIVSNTFDIAGDVLSLPFRLVGELFRVVF